MASSQAIEKVITVSNGGTEGEWGPLERCPPGGKAIGFQTRNELATPVFDDTALNTTILICNGTDSDIANITSTKGFAGDYQRVQVCATAFAISYMTSFSLRVQLPFNETEQGDKTAANNIRFMCHNDREIDGIGNTDGVWGDYSERCESGICGLETRVQPYDGGIGHYDNTALNDVRLFTCCPDEQVSTIATPK
ncbi:hypothetical protein DAPPUDRAFT_314044 [Daphnia pulex]|uniref:Vitelline membrane outer layer protein 1 n=1 Tax=Daphnia pulex TaxID=6669 RepID=E9G4I9_DAPPU|nr:hypothetical protein DAPPUDRAFT_314044 [Daphnia pulex]|eukprot:EFX85312.1 hypothetical protein DAPPUDRAFT_314044 [Daphnia pulex]